MKGPGSIFIEMYFFPSIQQSEGEGVALCIEFCTEKIRVEVVDDFVSEISSFRRGQLICCVRFF